MRAIPHFTVQTFERECICPPPAREPGEHTAECNAKQRADFLGAKQQARDDYYGTDRRTLN